MITVYYKKYTLGTYQQVILHYKCVKILTILCLVDFFKMIFQVRGLCIIKQEVVKFKFKED